MKEQYQAMSVEALEEANQNFMQQHAEINANQKVLAEVLEEKRAKESLARDVKKLQEKHGAALQVLGVTGIESGEEVNGG